MFVDIKNARPKLALAILTGALITVAKEMLPLVTDKTIKDLSK